MTFEPLLSAPVAVQIHVATVVPAAFLGAVLLVRAKGSPGHRLLGRIWMMLMVVTAISTLFIHEINMWAGFSPIHLLSVVMLWSAYQAVRAARLGKIQRHARIVSAMYWGGIVVAGVFTFLPGRIMNAVIIGGGGISSTVVIVAIVSALAYVFARSTGGLSPFLPPSRQQEHRPQL